MNKREIAGYTRVQKRTAVKLYNEGEAVYLLPVNVRPDNPWEAPYKIHRSDKGAQSIDQIISYYSYYNCRHNQTGLYPAFYTRQEGRP